MRKIALLLMTLHLTSCFAAAQLGVQEALDAAKGTERQIVTEPPNTPPVVSIQTLTASSSNSFGDLSGDITINYLLQDVESDNASIYAEYSDDDGVTWKTATPVGSSSTFTNLTASPAGDTYQFLWKSQTDAPSLRILGVLFKITPYRIVESGAEQRGEEKTSPPFNVDNNDAPSCEVSTPLSGLRGFIEIDYRLIDPNSDNIAIQVQFSSDGGKTFANANYAKDAQGNPVTPGEAVTGLASSVAGTDHIFLWDSVKDLGNVNADQVIVRITPEDQKQGDSGETDVFAVDGNDAPDITGLALPDILKGDIRFGFTLADTHSDPVVLTVDYSLDGTTFFPATPRVGTATTGISSSSSGTTVEFFWNSIADLGYSYNADVRIRMSATDGTDVSDTVYLPALSTDPKMVVNNNEPPIVELEVVFAGSTKSGGAVVRYRLTDSHSDPADMTIEYSIAGGAWQACTEDTSNVLNQGLTGLSASPSGIINNFVWDTAADIVRSPNVKLRLTAKDPVVLPVDPINATSAPITSGQFTVDNTSPPECSITTPNGGQFGNIPIDYLLLDAESALGTILVEYEEIGSGLGFQTAQQGSGGAGLTNITSSPAGIGHTYVWNSTQVGLTLKTVRLKITPSDTRTGDPSITPAFTVDNTIFTQPGQQPILTINQVQQVGQDIEVQADIYDTPAVGADLTVEYTLDDGSTYYPATTASTVTSVTTSATFPGSAYTFTWNAFTDLGATYHPAAQLRFTAVDNTDPSSPIPSITSPFVVNNNDAPVFAVSGAAPSGTISGNVTVSYTVTDNESDYVNVDVHYSKDAGANWSECTPTLASGGTQGLIPGSSFVYTFVWDAKNDLGPKLQTGVLIRFTPADAYNSGTAFVSGSFAVDNNNAPVVVVQTPQGIQSGNVVITYELQDTAAEAVSAVIEYSFGTPSPWVVCTDATTGAAANLSGLATSVTGEAHFFTWASQTDLPAQAKLRVYIRITPSDAGGAGLSKSTSSFSLDNTTAPQVAVQTPLGTNQSSVNILYTATDAESQNINLQVEYSFDGGVNFKPASPGIGGDGIVDITTSPTGVSHTYVWNSADIGNIYSSSVKLRFRPEDTKKGSAVTTGTFTVNNSSLSLNKPPSATVTTPSTLESGDVTLSFTVADAESDLINVQVEYRGGSTGVDWRAATIQGSTSNLAPGAYSLTWNSATDEAGEDASFYQFRIIPSDASTGGYAASGEFSVDNQSPVVSVSYPNGGQYWSGLAADVITWTTVDKHKSTVKIEALASATGTPQLIAQSVPDTGSYSIAASAINALTASQTTRIVITATDAGGNTGSGQSDADFAVDKTSPVATLLGPNGGTNYAGAGGVLPITWSTTELNKSTVKLEYSTDDFVSEVFTIVESAPDNGSFQWSPIPNIDSVSVKIRVTPTDAAGRVGTSAKSASAFTIDSSNPTVLVGLPTAGSVYGVGGTLTVSWATQDISPGTVVIEYSNDNFVSDINALPGAGSSDNRTDNQTFQWTPASPPKNVNLKIRVTPTDSVGHTGIPSSSGSFQWQDVIVNTLSPNAGTTSGGTPVFIYGSGFSTGVTVSFGGTSASGITRHSSSILSCITPAGAGNASVLVSNPDGSNILASGAYTYQTATSPGTGMTYADSAGSLGISDTSATVSSAWLDYNKDGIVDLFKIRNGVNQMLRGTGSGFNAENMSSLGMNENEDSLSVTTFDYDADGDIDVFVGNSSANDRLYSNNAGVFTDVGGTTGSAGLTSSVETRGAIHGDFDADGKFDVFLSVSTANEDIFYNNLGGSFVNIASVAGLTDATASRQAAFGDIDDDGDLDIYIAKDGQDLLYLNAGNNTFTDITSAAGLLGDSLLSIAVTMVDVNNDTLLDIFVSNESDAAFLWINQGVDSQLGHPTFIEDASALGVTAAGASYTTRSHCALDYDNDGDLDIVEFVNTSAFLYTNDISGAGNFTSAAAPFGAFAATPQGCCVADYEADGDLDIFVGGGSSEADRFYVSTGFGGNFIRVNAVTDADGSATDATLTDDFTAFGAKVYVDLDGNADFDPLAGNGVMRVDISHTSSRGQSEPIAHIGTGTNATSVSVKVVFMDGGTVTYSSIVPNQTITVRDP
ncbi:MAG: FG-GAP-like repeat-containing protein [Planctomycetes bacterium]|nr:FG-GAP-like repeat-containing protein [Planctomycetota bacterium]